MADNIDDEKIDVTSELNPFSVKLMANLGLEATTVTVGDVRKFVEDMAEINKAVRTARKELKEAIVGDERFEELKGAIEQAKAAMKVYVEGHTVYKEYIQAIENLKTEKKDLIDNAKALGVPKKEVDSAIKMLKSDIDPDSTSEIYSYISDLIKE